MSEIKLDNWEFNLYETISIGMYNNNGRLIFEDYL